MTLTAGTLALHIDESACYVVQSPLSYQDLKERKKSILFKTKIKCALDIFKPFWLHYLLPAAFRLLKANNDYKTQQNIFWWNCLVYLLRKWSKTPLSIECRKKKKYQTKRHLNDQSKNKVHNITNWWEFKFDKIIACEDAQAGQREVGNLSPSWRERFLASRKVRGMQGPGKEPGPP